MLSLRAVATPEGLIKSPVWFNIVAFRAHPYSYLKILLKTLHFMKRVVLCLFVFFAIKSFGQQAIDLEKETQVQLASTIKASDLKDYLSTIASDDFEGRETGTTGQKKAAKYIAEFFQKLGLPPIGDDQTYFQKIAYTAENWNNIYLSVNGKEVKHLWEHYSYPSTNSDRDTTTFKEVVFLGYGIDDKAYSDYKRAKVKGKAILIYAGEPYNEKGLSYITKTSNPSDWTTNWRKKMKTAKEKGVHTVFIIDPDFKNNVVQARRIILNSRMHLGDTEKAEDNYANNFFISTEVARQIIGEKFNKVVKAREKIKKKGKSKKVKLSSDIKLYQNKKVRQLLGENVLGFVEGTDEKLKNEIVVVTAHYDHLGKRGDNVYNGADDNGSGTSTVLEIAQAVVEAKDKGMGPKRSILFMLVSGEEKGLLGSQYYVENPIFSLNNTIANVNIDMVGRVDEKHKDNPNYIYVIGSNRLSTELHEINENANKEFTQLELDYTYNAKDDPNRYYYRSDHYNFAEKGIPAIFYFNGTHEDYHRITDTVDKINFEKMEKIARLVFHTTWELANRKDRIKVDVPTKP